MMPMQMWFGPVGHGSATYPAYLWPEAGVERNMVRNDVIAHARSPLVTLYCAVQYYVYWSTFSVQRGTDVIWVQLQVSQTRGV